MILIEIQIHAYIKGELFINFEVPTIAETSDAHGDDPIHGASNRDTHSHKEDREVQREKE